MADITAKKKMLPLFVLITGASGHSTDGRPIYQSANGRDEALC